MVSKTPNACILLVGIGIVSAFIIFGSSKGMASYLSTVRSFSTELMEPLVAPLLDQQSTGITPDTDSNSFSRALEESLGFFDDIPEDKWLRRKSITLKQEHLVDNTNHNYPQGWYYKNWHPDFTCEFEDFIGIGDGGKWICDPHRLLQKQDCLVYSIGSNGHFEFEANVQKALPNCEIHTFDFDNFTDRMIEWGVNGSFHAWGLGSSSGKRNIGRRDKHKIFKSFRETVAELGHQGRFIDLFKIDCEGCEWISYMDWFDNPGILGMRQILVETHKTPEDQAEGFFQYLHDQGYVMFHKEPNIQYGGGHSIEFAFLQLNKTFFNTSTTVMF